MKAFALKLFAAEPFAEKPRTLERLLYDNDRRPVRDPGADARRAARL